MSKWRRRRTVAVAGVVRAVATAALLGGCAVTADPQHYAERALREDAREAAESALAVEPRGGDDDDRRLGIDTTAVAHALGHARRLPGGMYEVRLPDAGFAVFHPAGGGQAALTGDVVLPAAAVPATLRALAAHGIAVTNVRPDSLATTDSLPGRPGSAVLHVWAVNDAGTMARGLQSALQITVLETAKR